MMNISSKFRALLIAGTASAALLSGGAPSSFLPLPHSSAAQAQAPASFADIVETIKPAVVSVQVKGHDSYKNNGRRSWGFGKRDEKFGFNEDGFRFEFGFPFFNKKDHDFDDDMKDYFSRRFGDEEGRQDSDQEGEERIVSIGSGFIISADGYMVTNYHVIEHGTSFTVIFDNGDEHEATVVGSDKKSDLAVLKINAKNDLPFVSFSDEPTRIGDWVLAVGNPFGLGGSVTAGIVSAQGRNIGSSIYDDFIQIDAPINRGNSGGPAFNTKGEVIGVSTAIVSPGGGSVGIGMAIPSASAKTIVNTLIERGEVDRGWLGVHIQSLDDNLVAALNLESTNGALINTIEDNTPAAKGGLEVGDVIIKVDGQEVENSRDLARKIGFAQSGATVVLDVIRSGKPIKLTIELGKQASESKQAKTNKHNEKKSRSKSSKPQKKLLDYGIKLARGHKSKKMKGLLVGQVKPGSLADKSGLQPGDRILALANKPINKPIQMVKAMDEAVKNQRPALLARIKRHGSELFIALLSEKTKL